MAKLKTIAALGMTMDLAFGAWAETRAPNYATEDGKDWVYNHAIAGKEYENEAANDSGVDLFYVYPTLVGGEKIVIDGFRGIDDETMRGDAVPSWQTAKGAFNGNARCFADMTRVYAPYYRQSTLDTAMDCATNGLGQIKSTANADYLTALYQGPAYADVTNALTVYFAKWNNGRKFMLAGHSQGSAILRLVMENYFTRPENKGKAKLLVASYQIGFGASKSEVDKITAATKDGDFAGVTCATCATDTCVIVSYNLFGPGASGNSVLLPSDPIAINPILWTTDTTPADKSLNLGALTNEAPERIVRGLYGATVNADRGTVECAEYPASAYVGAVIFGEKSLHGQDYPAFWANLNQNARERIFTATGKWPQRAPDYADASGRDWLFNHDIPEKRYEGEPAQDPLVDLFYLYPTAVIETNDHAVDNICDIDDEYLRSEEGALFSWEMAGEVFGDFTRVYAPYYRQTPVDYEVMAAVYEEEGIPTACDRAVEYWYNHAPYTDVTNALTYYFTAINPNGERPFILAGHSHGSGMLRLVMERFFTNDVQKAWLKKMVACYAVGFGLSPDVEETIREKAGVPFATNATDTGVYIMWNTQGADVTPGSPAALWPSDPVPSVNPLTWTREADAYAPATLNLGGWTPANTGAVEPGLYDASNFVANGTIICSALDLTVHYMPADWGFGENSLHRWDYKAYWENIRQNGWTRSLALSGLKKVETNGVVEVAGANWKIEVKGEGREWSEAMKSPVDGGYYVAGSAPADAVRLAYAMNDPASGKRFVNGETTAPFPMAYDGVRGVWYVTATESEIRAATKSSDTPTVRLGVVAQRYPWNGTLDIQYKTPYANAGVTVVFKATIGAEVIELGTAKGTGGKPAMASFDLSAIGAFKNKQLKSVKITATIAP